MPDVNPFSTTKRYQRLQDLETKYFIDQLIWRERAWRLQTESNYWSILREPWCWYSWPTGSRWIVCGWPWGSIPEWLGRYPLSWPRWSTTSWIHPRNCWRCCSSWYPCRTCKQGLEVDPAKARELARRWMSRMVANNEAYSEYFDSLEGLVKKSVDAVDTPVVLKYWGISERLYPTSSTKS